MEKLEEQLQLDNPRVTGSRVSILYSPINDLRKKIFDLEDRFSSKMEGEFLPPDLNPIPDDAPPEIPRIEFDSTRGHSNLSITPVRVDLNTEYDEGYYNDIEKCAEYIKNKSKSIDEVLGVIKPDIDFFAVKVVVQWPQKNLEDEEVIRILSEKLTSERVRRMKIKNFQMNYSLEHEGKFKLVQISNYRNFSSSGKISTPHPRLSNLEEKENGFKKEVEVNDRPKYNRGGVTKGTQQLADFLGYAKSEVESPIPS